MARIVYIGPDSGTSRHRFRALRRLGHDVRLVDPFAAIGRSQRLMSWGFKTGYMGLEHLIGRYVLGALGEERFDVVWVDNGEQIGSRLVTALKDRARFILNHNLDNPFTTRDGFRWHLFRKALPRYDLFVTPRRSTHDAALAFGARRVLEVMFSADEEAHRRIELTQADRERFGSEVAFVGTWMPERGPVMATLLARGVPLTIFGPRWNKAPEYPGLLPYLDNRSLDDLDYVKAISGAKIAIGLLSAGNEDLHTTRSLEIPAIGTLFCAPRTSDHEKLYLDGEEAVFFSSVDECASLCLGLLSDPSRLDAIARAGHDRARRNDRYNERLCSDILAAVLG